MDTDEYWDDAALPADELVIRYALAKFDADVDRRKSLAGKSNGIPADVQLWSVSSMFPISHTHPAVADPDGHLRDCPDREARHVAVASASTCGEGTCEYEPNFTVKIGCPHRRNTVTWTVEAETMGALINKIAAFAS
jgi:hypothetical protein